MRARALAALASLAFLAVPVGAGSAAAPEITDALSDVAVASPSGQTNCLPVAPPAVLAQCQFPNADTLAAWVDQETATSFRLNVKMAGTGEPSGLGSSYSWDFHFKVGGTEYVASAHLNGVAQGHAGGPMDGAFNHSGVASAANIDSSGDNGLLTMTVLKSAVGNPTSGALTSMYVHTDGFLASNNQQSAATDRAPDGDAFGTDYKLMGGSNSTGNAADSDGDGLNDTWEQQHLGGLSQNGTSDPDGDGCDNKCEFDHSSDPKKADTDGDGFSDGDEVKAGYSPTDPASHPRTTTSSSTTTTSRSGTSTSSSSGTGTSTGGSSSESKGSPGPGLALAAVAVLAAVAFRRRLPT